MRFFVATERVGWEAKSAPKTDVIIKSLHCQEAHLMVSNVRRVERRQFLSHLGMMAAASGLAMSAAAEIPGTPSADAAQPMLPGIQLGKYRVTRLIAGWNTIGGHSYQGAHMD
jgi:hypothetical protein